MGMRWTGTILAVAAAAMLGCANALHDDDGHDGEAHEQELPLVEIAGEADTSLRAAIGTALKAQPGVAYEAELEGEIDDGEREVAYEILILGSDGTVYEATVAPRSGTLLEVEEEDEAEEIAEIRAVAATQGNGARTLADLIGIAEKHVNGRALEAEIELDDEGAVCEVVLQVGDGFVEVELDPRDGRILEVEEADDDDEDDDDE